MNNLDNLINVIEGLELKFNLNCMFSETQNRKIDEITFVHTVFKANNEHKFLYLLIVILGTETVVLGSDIYTTNEIVDKVEKKDNKIFVNKDGICQVAI